MVDSLVFRLDDASSWNLPAWQALSGGNADFLSGAQDLKKIEEVKHAFLSWRKDFPSQLHQAVSALEEELAVPPTSTQHSVGVYGMMAMEIVMRGAKVLAGSPQKPDLEALSKDITSFSKYVSGSLMLTKKMTEGNIHNRLDRLSKESCQHSGLEKFLLTRRN